MEPEQQIPPIMFSPTPTNHPRFPISLYPRHGAVVHVLEETRVEFGVSKYQMARLLGIPHIQSYHRWLRDGENRPSAFYFDLPPKN